MQLLPSAHLRVKNTTAASIDSSYHSEAAETSCKHNVWHLINLWNLLVNMFTQSYANSFWASVRNTVRRDVCVCVCVCVWLRKGNRNVKREWSALPKQKSCSDEPCSLVIRSSSVLYPGPLCFIAFQFFSNNSWRSKKNIINAPL